MSVIRDKIIEILLNMTSEELNQFQTKLNDLQYVLEGNTIDKELYERYPKTATRRLSAKDNPA